MKDGKLNTSMNFTGWHSRAETLTVPSAKNEDGSYPIIITTEAPAEVVDWERFEMVREILLMKGAIFPENKQVPFLDSHSRFSTSDTIGAVRNFNTENTDATGNVYWWSGASEQKSKVDEKLITDVSAGYRTFPEFTVELKAGEEKEIEGKMYKNDFPDKKPLLIRTRWELKEVSLVPIGADKAAKFRSELQPGIKSEDPQLQKKIDDVFKEINDLKIKNEQLITTINKRKNPMEPTVIPVDEQVKLELERREGIEAISTRVKKIYKGSEGDLKAVAEKAVAEKWSVDKFRAHVWENADFDKPLDTPDSQLDLTGKEIADYDIMKMVRHVMNPNDRATREAAKFEIECSEAIAEKIGSPPKGIYLPYDVQVSKTLHGLNKRDLTAGTDASGGYLVGTDHRPDLFIELLRNKMVSQRLGARMLRGLVGDVSIPKWTTGATAVWAATESAAMTESTPVTGNLTLTPKDVGASVDISRRLMLQGSPDAGALVMDDIATILAIAIDKAVLHGSGASGQPTGIANTSGIGAVTGASYAWADAVEHESDVDTGNALEGTFAYITTPAIKGTLKTREKSSGYPVFLCGDNNVMNGYPVISTNQINSGFIFFGNFAQIILAEWSNMDIYPTLIERTGVTVITAITTVDVGVRQPGAFSVATSVT